MNLSCVVLTKNSQNSLKQCLESLSFCDEILVIDDFSEDETEKISKKFKTKFIKRKLSNNFSSQRNFGLKNSSGDWVLFVDSDEVVLHRLSKEILFNIKNAKSIQGYYIKRIEIYGKNIYKHGEWGKSKFLRLARRNSGLWKRSVHEYWKIEGKKGFLRYPIFHKRNFKMSDFINKINYYSDIHSAELIKEKKKSNLIKILFWPILKFCKNYIYLEGYKDRDFGFIMSLFMSFHSFLGWAKVWQKEKHS